MTGHVIMFFLAEIGLWCEFYLGNATCTGLLHYNTTLASFQLCSQHLLVQGRANFWMVLQRNAPFPAASESWSRLCAHKHWPHWGLIHGFAKVLLVHSEAIANEKRLVEISTLSLGPAHKRIWKYIWMPYRHAIKQGNNKLLKGNPVMIPAIIIIVW